MARGKLKSERCVHEPVHHMGAERAADFTALIAKQSAISFLMVPNGWHCAKCKRRIVARWSPAPESAI